MTMIPGSQRPSLDATWSRFMAVTDRLAGKDPLEELATFGEFLLLRDALFARLMLPVTAHNSLRLYDCAEAHRDLDAFLEDVDAFLPAAVVDDELLLLAALSGYFDAREVHGLDARVYDVEAFLGVPHHRHNDAVVRAWLVGAVDYVTLRSHVSGDAEHLDAALC